MILAIDPGKMKCGLAVLDESGNVLERRVLSRGELANQVMLLIPKYRVFTIVIGRGAQGKSVEKELSRLELRVNLIFVSEKDTSWQARQRYWRENRPSGWRRIIPTSLRVPLVPIDDYAAVIIGERYLSQ